MLLVGNDFRTGRTGRPLETSSVQGPARLVNAVRDSVYLAVEEAFDEKEVFLAIMALSVRPRRKARVVNLPSEVKYVLVGAAEAVHAVDIVPLLAANHELVRAYGAFAVQTFDHSANLCTLADVKHVAVFTLMLL